MAEKSVVWPPSLDDDKVEVVSASKKFGSDGRIPSGRHEPTYTDLLSGLGSNTVSTPIHQTDFMDRATGTSNPLKRCYFDQGKFNMHGGPWSTVPPGLSLSLLESSTKVPAQPADSRNYRVSNLSCGFNEYAMLHNQRSENAHGNWFMSPPSALQYGNSRSREVTHKPMLVQQKDSMKPKDGDCKLFGISLNGPVMQDPSMSCRDMGEPADRVHIVPDKTCTSDSQQEERLRGAMVLDNPLALGEQPEKSAQTAQQQARDIQCKRQIVSTRSCTKVCNLP